MLMRPQLCLGAIAVTTLGLAGQASAASVSLVGGATTLDMTDFDHPLNQSQAYEVNSFGTGSHRIDLPVEDHPPIYPEYGPYETYGQIDYDVEQTSDGARISVWSHVERHSFQYGTGVEGPNYYFDPGIYLVFSVTFTTDQDMFYNFSAPVPDFSGYAISYRAEFGEDIVSAAAHGLVTSFNGYPTGPGHVITGPFLSTGTVAAGTHTFTFRLTGGSNEVLIGDASVLLELSAAPQTVIPTPAAAGLGLVALGGAALRRRRRRY